MIRYYRGAVILFPIKFIEPNRGLNGQSLAPISRLSSQTFYIMHTGYTIKMLQRGDKSVQT